MKKIISLVLFSAIIIAASAQCFEKGSKVIGLGSGLGIYKTVWEDKTNSNITDDNDGAGAFVFPLTFEYGLLNWLGAGARLGYNNYIEGNDSNNTNENARGIDFNGFVNLHFLRTNHVDMFMSGEFGYSDFKYTADVTSSGVTNSAMAKASGTGYSVGLNTRFYFGKNPHFGINLRFAFEGFNYENGEITDSQGSAPYKFGLKGNGNVFGIGLQYKI